MTGTIFDVKEMAVHDGPGLRTTVFFKGCPLRCRWCHNPEGFTAAPRLMYKENTCTHCNLCCKPCDHADCKPFGRCLHICPQNCLTVAGRTVTPAALAQELRSTAEILGERFGGFTFSGGEPLAQAEFLFALTEELKGHHLCIETCGHAPREIFQKMPERMDFIIMDLKLADDALHQKYTGVSNKQILQNLQLLQESGKPHLLRTPLIPGITDTPENLAAIQALAGNSPWEQLPYNTAAGAKYKMLGMEYPLD